MIEMDGGADENEELRIMIFKLFTTEIRNVRNKKLIIEAIILGASKWLIKQKSPKLLWRILYK